MNHKSFSRRCKFVGGLGTKNQSIMNRCVKHSAKAHLKQELHQDIQTTLGNWGSEVYDHEELHYALKNPCVIY